MPVRAAQLLVRTPSLEALAAQLGHALRRQKLPAAGMRSLAVLYQAGWACVLEPGRVDFGLARLLSEGGGPQPWEVHALELDGARFLLKLRTCRGGEPGPLRQEPVDAGPLLPVVCDVEQEAWDFLRELGVPAPLRLCSFDEVRLFEAADASEAGLASLQLTLTGTGLETRALRGLPPDRSEGLSPPARPDSLVESRAGESLALEVRKLPPLEPTQEAADALASVEEQAALRLCLELGPLLEQERLPRPAFAYQCGTLPELLPLLDEAREARPWLTRLCHPGVPAPLSHAGFAARSRALLAVAVPDARVLRVHGLTLELRHPGAPDATLLIDLAPRWQAVLLGEEAEPDPAHADASSPLVEEVDQRLREPLLPLTALPRSTFLAGLLPALLTEQDSAFAPSAPLPGLLPSAARLPLPRVGLWCDAAGQLRPVEERALAAHGLSLEAALVRAVENVDARTLAAPGGLHLFDLDHGRVAMTGFSDAGGAGRLASTAFRELLFQVIGPALLVCAPTRDTLFACPESEEGAQWLAGEAALRRSEGPFPLAGPLLLLDAEGLRAREADDS